MIDNFVKHHTGCDYQRLFESINAERILLRDQRATDVTQKRYYAIRHDVDDDWPNARKMAKWEAERGLLATYYLLASRRYFDYSPAFLSEVKEVEDLGHEIGFHNDALIQWAYSDKKVDVREAIEKPLRMLRSAGVTVVGTAAHGDQICRDLGFNSFEVWTENPKALKNPSLDIPRFSLSEFDLEYEAYWQKRTAYLSDNHGGWSGGFGKEIPAHEVIGTFLNEREKILAGFHSLDYGMLQVLIHPQHWMPK